MYKLSGTLKRFGMGLLVDNNGTEQRHSFWIDDGQNEAQLFHRLAEVLAAYSDYRIFHYGSYETVFLRRLAKVDHFKAPIDQILPARLEQDGGLDHDDGCAPLALLLQHAPHHRLHYWPDDGL